MSDRPSTPPPAPVKQMGEDVPSTPKPHNDNNNSNSNITAAGSTAGESIRTSDRSVPHGESGMSPGVSAGTNRPPPNLVSKPTISTPVSSTGHAAGLGEAAVAAGAATTTGTVGAVGANNVGSPAAKVGLLGSGLVGGSPGKQNKKGAAGGLGKGARKAGGEPASNSNSNSNSSSAQAQAQAQAQVDEKDPTRQGKGKDLSHVPCRFYKMGVCAAGDGCVFSHSGVDTGNTKQVCQWFLKGNCRFGHKCALAHLYPNEPPTMDRKHKKAAQLAANGATQEEIEAVVYGGASYILPSGGYAEDEAGGEGGEGDQQHDGGVAIPRESKPGGSAPGGKMSYSQSLKSPPSVRSGKTAAGDASVSTSYLDANMSGGPGRNRRESSSQDRTGAVAIKSMRAQAQREEAAISIGSISPANRHQAALLSTLNRPGSGAQAGASPSPSSTAQTFVYAPGASSSGSVPRSQGMTPRGPGDESENFKSRPVPLSVPGPLPMSARSGSFVQDPIGTPPRESGSFMLGRSLSGAGPYTAPGVRGSFSSAADAVTMRPGLKTTGFSESNVNMPPGSLTGPKFSSSVMGAEFGQMGRDIWGQRTSLAPQVTRTHSTQSGMSRPILDLTSRRESEVFMLDDADGDDVDAAEEFLPGSLTELLNPREKARRLSRRESGSTPGVGSGSVGIRAGWVSSSGDAPALGGIGSAGSSWDSRPNMEALLNRQALSAGAVDGGFLRSLWDDAGEDARRRARQDSDLPPASASAAVGGLSSMFAGSSGGGTSNNNNKSSDGNLTAPPDTGFQLGPSNASVAFLPTFTAHRQAALGDHGSPATRGNLHSPSRPSPLHRDTTTQAISSSRVPVEDGMEVQHTHLAPQHLRPLVSPGTRALETHAPGQSLPQGLAAGLSRLHLRPSPSRSTSGLTSGLVGGEALSPNASNIGQNVGRYETLARQDTSERPQVPQIQTPAGEGEDDDLFEMEG